LEIVHFSWRKKNVGWTVRILKLGGLKFDGKLSGGVVFLPVAVFLVCMQYCSIVRFTLIAGAFVLLSSAGEG
jgi:hypothetical protein